MNDDERDPILRGLDDLAASADDDQVTDRMAVISRKARANRIRKGTAGAACLAVLAVGAVGALQLLPGRETIYVPAPASTPSVSAPSAPSTPSAPSAPTTPSAPASPSTPPATGGLVIDDVIVSQIARTTLGVSFRIHGTSQVWSEVQDDQPLGFAGPRYTRVLLDGQRADAGGDDRSEITCRAGTPEKAYDATVLGQDLKGIHVDVPGPGTYTVTVQAPYCGADGTVVPREVSQTVTVTDPEMVVTDETSVDIDGDGRADRIQVLMPQADRQQGQSAYLVAKVTRASGQTTEFPIRGFWVPTVAGAADLNDDGVPEVQIVASGENHTSWSVLTFTDGKVVAATPVSAGEQDVQPDVGTGLDGSYQQTWLRNGQLVSWFSPTDWDRESSTQVTLSAWVLDGAQLSLSDQTTTVCVTSDPKTWTKPGPC